MSTIVDDRAVHRVGLATTQRTDKPRITSAASVAFQRDTCHAHQHRDAAIRNHTALLTAMGRTRADIAATIAALRREAGLDQG